MIRICLLSAIVFAANSTVAQTLFESYYRIEKNREHVGYLVQRLTKATNGTLDLRGYAQFKRGEREPFQSYVLQARGPSALPLSSEHKSNDGIEPLLIQAKFTPGGKGTFRVTETAKGRLLKSGETAPTSFFGGFLFFVADLEHMQKNEHYRYQAFAEERARVATGLLVPLEQKTIAQKRVQQYLDTYLGQAVESFVSPKGIPLGSRIDADKLVVYWVPDKEAAVGTLDFPDKRIKQIFGSIPKGGTSPWEESEDFRADAVIASFPPPNVQRTISSEGKVRKLMPTRKF